MAITDNSIPPSAQPPASASQVETQEQTQYTTPQDIIYGADEDLDLNGSKEDDMSDCIPDTSQVEETQCPSVYGQEKIMYQRQLGEHEAWKEDFAK